MKKLLCALAFLVSVSTAHAVERDGSGRLNKCTISDAWRGPDKTKHALGGGAIGAAVTAATKDPELATLVVTVVAGGKEIWDRRGNGTCSFQDFAVTVAAGAAAAYGTNWIITPREVIYTKRLNLL